MLRGRLLTVLGIVLALAARSQPLVVVGSADNDLVRAMKGSKIDFELAENALAAVKRAPPSSGVMILAGAYPEQLTQIDPAVYEQAARKNLRLYVEYPSFVPGIKPLSHTRTPTWERAVVTSDDFGPALAPMRLLAVHSSRFIPFDRTNLSTKIVLARVAGFDTAVYGLPKETFPLLFELPGDAKVLVASTKLSGFITARYAPSEAWRSVWEYVFRWLGDAQAGANLRWTPSVAPSFARDVALTADVELIAIRRGLSWFARAGMFVDSSWSDLVEKAATWPDRTGPLDAQKLKPGNGSLGILEGYNASIDATGHQPVRWFRRADCNGEAAMAFALAGKITSDPAALNIAANLNDFEYTTSAFAKAAAGGADDPACGLIGWSDNTGSIDQFYGDDNARVILGAIASSAALHSDKWDAGLARCLLGNLRTTGRLGFRDYALARGDLRSRGWQSFFRRRNVALSPHFESWLWAGYLWAYDKSHYAPFRDRAVEGIKAMMAGYPSKWRWTNGLQQERARMLLPLAWLVRIEDTPQHRGWLRKITTDLLASQDACGAIREELGDPKLGGFGPPKSNEAYGTGESSMIQQNGDPLADLLYTSNFAFVGLHEAAAATGDSLYRNAEDKLAAFLCRIQIRSAAHPELDGGWFRAFDFHRWDYWASSADFGWGAWSIETGWTQTWIVSTLSLRQLQTSLWDISRDSAIAKQLAVWQPQMIPDAAAAALVDEEAVRHEAIGKPVTLESVPSPSYMADGPPTLTDGKLATTDDLQSGWLGFEGKDFSATVDLGRATKIHSAGARFLQYFGPGIFFPRSVTVEGSDDGKNYFVLGKIDPTAAEAKSDVTAKKFEVAGSGREARFIRIRAESVKVCPPAHRAAGQPAWIFVDEILVNP